MNYDVFSMMEDGSLSRDPAETEQAFMERVLSSVFSPVDDREKTINDKLNPRLAQCNANEKSLAVEFEVEDWMRNPSGNLHGGLLSTAVDIAVGVLARYYKQTRRMVTVNLTINYLSAVPADAKFCVHAAVDRVGRRMVFAHAEVFVVASEKLAATAYVTFT